MPTPNHHETHTDLPPLEVLYQEANMLVIQKPSGLLVHNSPFTKTREVSAMDAIQARFGSRFAPVHRLDRQTSGTLIFADRSEVSHWQKALVGAQKRYLALCRGHFLGAPILLDHPFKDKTRKDQRLVEAQTEIGCIQNSEIERCALLFAHPHTGRTHQIRRHIRHLTHPILGDANYGKGKLNRFYKERYGLKRLALHCAEITFKFEERVLSVKAPLPKDLLDVFEALQVSPLP